MEKPRSLICTTHAQELKGGWGENAGGNGETGQRTQRGEKWGKRNGIISKI